MHACGVLADHADRSKIAPAHLPLLDNFLAGQHALQKHLLIQVRSDSHFSSEMTSDQTIRENFHLLQACDNLSLMACVEYRKPATLLHALPLNDGGTSSVNVTHAGLHDPVFIGERHYRLHPYPFGELPLTLEFPARHIHGKTFSSDADIQHRFATAEVQMMTVVMTK
jgi:hypothetical protein